MYQQKAEREHKLTVEPDLLVAGLHQDDDIAAKVHHLDSGAGCGRVCVQTAGFRFAVAPLWWMRLCISTCVMYIAVSAIDVSRKACF